MVLGVVTTALGTTSTAQSHPSRQVRLARGCHWHWPSHKRVTSTTRWIDDHSPYRKKHAISGNVSVDPRLWADWMRYLRASGVRAYEQDWLSGPAVPERNLTSGELFMDAMAKAAGKRRNCAPVLHATAAALPAGNTLFQSLDDSGERRPFRQGALDILSVQRPARERARRMAVDRRLHELKKRRISCSRRSRRRSWASAMRWVNLIGQTSIVSSGPTA